MKQPALQLARCCSLATLLVVAFDSYGQDSTKDTPVDVSMTWVEKYVTYKQDDYGQLTQTDVHFLAEIIFDGDRDFNAISASLFKNDESEPLATYDGQTKRAFTNGYFYTRKSKSFQDVEKLEAEHPPSSVFSWAIEGPNGKYRLAPIRIGGAELASQFPAVSTIRLYQDKKLIQDFRAIDATSDTTVEWNPFEIGGPLVGTEWNDLVFVLISDCRGDVVFTAGAPGTDKDFADYTETSVVVPGNTLPPGQTYTLFTSQVNYVDHNLSNGITQLAANSFAVELIIETAGSNASDDCPTPPRPAQYLWTRKTIGDRMQSWPALADHW